MTCIYVEFQSRLMKVAFKINDAPQLMNKRKLLSYILLIGHKSVTKGKIKGYKEKEILNQNFRLF